MKVFTRWVCFVILTTIGITDLTGQELIEDLYDLKRINPALKNHSFDVIGNFSREAPYINHQGTPRNWFASLYFGATTNR